MYRFRGGGRKWAALRPDDFERHLGPLICPQIKSSLFSVQEKFTTTEELSRAQQLYRRFADKLHCVSKNIPDIF